MRRLCAGIVLVLVGVAAHSEAGITVNGELNDWGVTMSGGHLSYPSEVQIVSDPPGGADTSTVSGLGLVSWHVED